MHFVNKTTITYVSEIIKLSCLKLFYITSDMVSLSLPAVAWRCGIKISALVYSRAKFRRLVPRFCATASRPGSSGRTKAEHNSEEQNARAGLISPLHVHSRHQVKPISDVLKPISLPRHALVATQATSRRQARITVHLPN